MTFFFVGILGPIRVYVANANIILIKANQDLLTPEKLLPLAVA